MAPIATSSKRNIIFFGETGTGKSSAINLLLETGTFAPVSNDSQPCTQASLSYETTLNSMKYNLWDTRGLGEGHSFFRAIFRGGSGKELKKFLKERCRRDEIDLLVYCVRGSRATKASVKYYDNFCAIERRLVAPVVVVVTQLEKEEGDMEDWWNRNSSELKKLKMEFDDHVCITTLSGHPRLAESKKRLVDLITRNYHWKAKDSGSYFGTPVQKYIPFTSSRKGGISRIFKAKDRSNVGDGGLNRRPNDSPRPFSTAPSTRDSSYHTASSTRDSSYLTAESPGESIPPSPVVEPPTPRNATTSAKAPHINPHFLGVGDPSQSSSEETSSMESSSHSMLYTSSHSSHTSHSGVHLPSRTEENEDYLSKLPFKHSNATIRRRASYATRRGGFGDIWECDLISGESSRMVAVKAVKFDTDGYEDLRSHEKKLRRELKVWGRLRHRNVVPLLGLVSGFGPLPSMVSPWFCNGSLSCYLAHHQTLNLLGKHRLLGDIAAGLCYLHSQDVIHGDLHSDNVLIDGCGTACLTDFGLSLINEFVGTSYLKSSTCGVVQFADPALFQRINISQDKVFHPTKPCDMYSFGGLMLHVLSGKKPYDAIPPAAILLTVFRGERPQIPTHNKHITSRHESVIRMCWDHEEHKRPSADDLVKLFDLQ